MIQFLDQNFSQLNHFLTKDTYSRIFILVDENTHENCLPILLGNLETSTEIEILEIEAGEEMKNIQTAIHLWEILTEMHADRKALIVNLGGGVVTDMGGFVAATYKRGISFINVPTTLLAMCDASIGGKTGIDLMHYKNMVGTFSLPEHIFVYPSFLSTLPSDQLLSGFAEMLKHGLIADKNHWNSLTQISDLDAENIIPHVKRSMEIKQNVVDKDFHEENIRKTLNFGHTIGHSLESLFLEDNTPILHGEAVALGMICETYLSKLENLISEEQSETIIKGIRSKFSTIDISKYSNEAIVAILVNDKKNSNSNINFSLLHCIGAAVFNHQCQTENIVKSLNYYRNLCNN
ncbi:3-dehydroquinate synthase [Chryseobacterium sp.]|uniref:3-dehydroquinate synthase n=1 Tax=Chryseobacterium sp. TaxID=1871047 RepID=UPI00388F42BA